MNQKLWIATFVSYMCLFVAFYSYINGYYYRVFIFVIIGLIAAVAKTYYKQKTYNPYDKKEIEIKTLANLGKKRK